MSKNIYFKPLYQEVVKYKDKSFLEKVCELYVSEGIINLIELEWI